MTNNEAQVCAELEKNLADEAEAREGYYVLLTKFGSDLTKEEQSEIDEIISEELKHSVILHKIVERLSKIKPETD